jgi:dienelactone hydrolase
MKPLFLIAAMLLACAISPTGTVCAQPAQELYWGGYRAKGVYTFEQLRIGNDRGKATAAIGSDNFSGTIQGDAISLNGSGRSYALHKTAEGLDGTITVNGSSYLYHSRRVVDLPEALKDALVGGYDADNGDPLAIGKTTSGNLWLCNERTGDIRLLFPITDTELIAGPSFLISDPPQLTLHFSYTGTAVSQLVLTQDGKTVRAPRTHTYLMLPATFSNGPVQLSGTLLKPRGAGPHPAVIVLHGSGPQNRSGYLSYMLFMADAYARAGIAALIYDKRGVGASTGDWRSASFDDLANDANAAAHWLMHQSGIDRSRIGASGVSQAGWIMALLSQKFPQLKFVVMQSAGGSGLTAEQQEMLRIRLQMHADGFSENDIKDAQAFEAAMNRYAQTRQGYNDAKTLYDKASTPKRAAWLRYTGDLPDPDDGYWNWWRSIMSYDPYPAWAQYQGRIFALFGSLDTETPVQRATSRFLSAMKTKPHRYTMWYAEGATHDFYVGHTGGENELPDLQRMIPGYYKRITSWVLSVTRGSNISSDPQPLAGVLTPIRRAVTAISAKNADAVDTQFTSDACVLDDLGSWHGPHAARQWANYWFTRVGAISARASAPRYVDKVRGGTYVIMPLDVRIVGKGKDAFRYRYVGDWVVFVEMTSKGYRIADATWSTLHISRFPR